MKKLLLTILSLFIGITAFALDNPATVSFSGLPTTWPTAQASAADFSNVILDGITFNFTKCCRSNKNLLVAGKNNPGASGFDFKLEGTVTKVELTVPGGTAQLSKPAVALYVNDVLIDSQTWTSDNGATYTYTVPEDKQLEGAVIKFVVGTSSTKLNAQIASMKVYYIASSKESAGLSYNASAYDVKFGSEFASPKLTNPYNLPITYTTSVPEVATVNESGDVTILATGTTVITATSAATEVYNAGMAYYTLNVIDASKYAANIAAFVAGAPNKNDEMIMENDVTVVYVNGSYVYISDDSGSSLIYKSGLGYKKGNVIPGGWTGKASPYNGLYEIVPVSTMPASSKNVDVVYPDMENIPTIEDANKVVVLKNVEFNTATPATAAEFTGKMGDVEVPFYNTFRVAAKDVAVYDVTAAISVRNNSLSVYPISYVKTGDAVPAEKKNFSTIGEFINEAYTGPSVITTPMTVIYQNGRNLYVKDENDGYLLIYNQGDLATIAGQFKNGDIISSVTGTYKDQYGLPEIIPTEVGTKSEGSMVEPEEATIEELSTNTLGHYVKLKNVKIEAVSGVANTYTVTDADEASIQLYNTFNNSSYYNPVVKVTTGDNMGIIGFVAVKDGTLQINPIEVYDMNTNAIDSIVVDGDENAPVEYFNIQGVRVNADQLVPGLYIVRQGSKTSKIIVK